MILVGIQILLQTAVIVALVTLVGTILQHILAPWLNERRKAKKQEKEKV